MKSCFYSDRIVRRSCYAIALLSLGLAITISFATRTPPTERPWLGYWKGASEFCLLEDKLVSQSRDRPIANPVRYVEKPGEVEAIGNSETMLLVFSDRDPKQARVYLVAGDRIQPVGRYRWWGYRCPS